MCGEGRLESWNRAVLAVLGMESGGGSWDAAGPGGIWEALLRFIGVGILWTRGIIHGKASLSGSVYTMRQG